MKVAGKFLLAVASIVSAWWLWSSQVAGGKRSSGIPGVVAVKAKAAFISEGALGCPLKAIATIHQEVEGQQFALVIKLQFTIVEGNTFLGELRLDADQVVKVHSAGKYYFHPGLLVPA